jgi:hypothetical protein
MEARAEDLLPVVYFHVVFSEPAEVAQIAYANKAMVYDLLFNAASQTLLTIAADPKHLGAKIGMTSVLHTCIARQAFAQQTLRGGSAMTHQLVPGNGLPANHERAMSTSSCRVVAFHLMANDGLPAAEGSSCLCGYCLGCIGDCFSKASRRRTQPESYSSLETSPP